MVKKCSMLKWNWTRRKPLLLKAAAFMMMDDGIQMQTIFGDGSQQQNSGGFLDKLLGAGKRMLVGESLFMTAFTNVGVW